MTKVEGFEKGLPFEDIDDVATFGGPVAGGELVEKSGGTKKDAERALNRAQKKKIGASGLSAFLWGSSEEIAAMERRAFIAEQTDENRVAMADSHGEW